MLRRPLSRPPLLRPFSTSLPTWNAQRPTGVDAQHKDEPPKSSPQPSQPQVDHDIKPELIHSATQYDSKPQSTTPHDTLASYDLPIVKQRIREWTEQATIALRNRADDFTASTKTTFSQLGSQLNRVTGYEEIEALKRGVVEQGVFLVSHSVSNPKKINQTKFIPEEERINVARQASRKAKSAYEEAVVQRSNSQREVNDLLQRKNTWVDNDVVRFTNLVRQDHLYEQEESRAKAAVNETEDGVEREFSQLLRTILARYHEEQVWSDKIRSASTYGSLAALGLNMFVFILAILLVEPWKRRRLAQTFERKIEELSAENETRLDASMHTITQQIARQSALLEALKEEVTRNVQESFPETVSVAQEDSQGETPLEDRSDVRVLSWAPSRRQLEMAAVGAGAFVVGILSTMLFSR